MVKPGLFITFEGCEGSGKSTLCNLVAKKLEEQGIECVVTREPGGVPIAEQIRSILLTGAYNEVLTPETEALLFAAARAQHAKEKIWPAMEQGKVVLCDRWLSSSLAYQGCARNLGVDAVTQINEFGIGDFRPDIEFFIDLQPEVGFERIKNRNGKDRIEQEDLNFHKQVYNFFNTNDNKYVVKLDGEASPQTNAQIVVNKILEALQS